MRNIVAVSAFFCLSACATPQYASYVGPLDPHLAPQVAGDMAAFVRARIKPTDGAIQIERPDGDLAIGPALAADLQADGFDITQGRATHRVRYAASMLSGDVMVRVSVDRSDAARLYRDKPGSGLRPLGPFSVTEIAR